MKRISILLLILFISLQIVAQNKISKEEAESLINNNKAIKKCVVGSLDYDKPFEWLEVDCSEIENSSKKQTTKEQLLKREQKKIKLIKYQEKLKTLGYEVEVNGLLDEKTIKAHNKYLKRKKKEEKRLRRKKKQ